MKLAKLLRIIPPYVHLIIEKENYFYGVKPIYKGRADDVKGSEEYKEVKCLDIMEIRPTNYCAPTRGELSLLIVVGGIDK